jgi:hypothetical protein
MNYSTHAWSPTAGFWLYGGILIQGLTTEAESTMDRIVASWTVGYNTPFTCIANTYYINILPSSCEIAFIANGLFSDVIGTVLTVDGENFTYGQLPLIRNWQYGSTLTFKWHTPLNTSYSNIEYVWTSTQGLSTLREGTLQVASQGRVIATFDLNFRRIADTKYIPKTPSSNIIQFADYYYVFYQRVSDDFLVYTSSQDGDSWSTPLEGSHAAVTQSGYTVFVNGTKLYLAYTVGNTHYIRVGSPTNGLITWTPATTMFSYSSTGVFSFCRTANRIYFAGTSWSDSGDYRYLTVQLYFTENGVDWTNIYSFTDRWYAYYFGRFDPAVAVVPYPQYADGVMFFHVYTSSSYYVYHYYRIYDGLGWSPQYSSPCSVTWGTFSACTFGNEVHLFYLSGARIYHQYFTTFWSSQECIEGRASVTGFSVTRYCDKLYLFYLLEGKVWYLTMDYVTHGWSTTSAWIYAGMTPFNLCSDANPSINRIGVDWLTENVQPYKLIFLWLDLPQITGSRTVQFFANGLASDAIGYVLKIDGIDYLYGELPQSFVWPVGSTHTFSWYSSLNASHENIIYYWTATLGESNLQAGSIKINYSSTIIGTYTLNYRIVSNTTGTVNAVMPERAITRIEDYYYVFYQRTTDGFLIYKSSVDGENWGAEQVASHAATSTAFTIFPNGTTIYLSYLVSSSVYVRTGVATDGTVIWNPASTILTYSSTAAFSFCKTANRIYFAATSWSDSGDYRYLTVQLYFTENGVDWTNIYSFTDRWYAYYFGRFDPAVAVVPYPQYADGVMFFHVYTSSSYYVYHYYRIYDGLGWSPQYSSPCSVIKGSFSTVAYGNDIHLIYVSSGKIYYQYYVTSWSTVTCVEGEASSYPSLSVHSDMLGLFYIVNDVLYYRFMNYSTHAWGGRTRWLSGGMSPVACLSSEEFPQLDSVSVVWRSGSISPYMIQFMKLRREMPAGTREVRFIANGLSSDAIGTVLVVDSVEYNYPSLPLSFVWDINSTHTFAWIESIPTGLAIKTYKWTATRGLATSRLGTLVVSSYGTVVANYEIYFEVIGTTATIPQGNQRSVAKIENFTYVFYQSPTTSYLVYRVHNGTQWVQNEYQISHAPVTNGEDYTVFSDTSGLYVAYSVGAYSTSAITSTSYLRRGTPDADGILQLDDAVPILSSRGYWTFAFAKAGSTLFFALQHCSAYSSGYQWQKLVYTSQNGVNWTVSLTHTCSAYTGTRYGLVITNHPAYPAGVVLFHTQYSAAYAYQEYDGTSWLTAKPLGLDLLPGQFSVTYGGGQVHLSYVSTGLWYRYFNGATWSSAVLLDSTSPTSPMLSASPEKLYAFYIRNNVLSYLTVNYTSHQVSSIIALCPGVTLGKISVPDTFSTAGYPIIWLVGATSPYYIKVVLM